MKKKLLVLLIVLLIMAAMLPTASAGWEGWVSCMVGDHVYYYVGSVEYGAIVDSSGIPAGLTLAEESTGSGRDLYLSGYPMYAGDYMVWISATDGHSYSCEVVVDDIYKPAPTPSPVTAPPYVAWTSNSVRCNPHDDVYVSVGVNNDGGWDLYYEWYKNGNAIYGAAGASFYCDTSSARKDVYQCKISAWKGNSNVTLWSNEVWVDVVATYVSNISIFRLPYKLDYTANDYLNTDGLGLTVTYNTGYQEKIYAGFSCSPTNLSKVGSQKITVSYGGCSTSFNVNVKEALKVSSISIDSSPDKVSYFLGDRLDTKGLGVLCNYTNGTSEYIYSGMNCTPSSFDRKGTQTVTVSYGGKTCSFTVEVHDDYESIDMSVVTLPTKTEYELGETLDLSGLTLNVKYLGGDIELIDSTNQMLKIEPKELNVPGQQTVVITLMEESHLQCSFNVNVKAPAAEPAAAEDSSGPDAAAAPAEEDAGSVPAEPAAAVEAAAPAKGEKDSGIDGSTVIWIVLGVLFVIIIALVIVIAVIQKQNNERAERMRKKLEQERRWRESRHNHSDEE